MPRRFDTDFNPVGSFHTHLYNDMPSTTDINQLIKDTKNDINNNRRIFSTSIMSIGGASENIRCYIPKFLKKSPNELLQELEEIDSKVNDANNRLIPYWDNWITRDPKKFYDKNDICMSPIIEEYFDTFEIFDRLMPV